jgi:predicted metalloprotease
MRWQGGRQSGNVEDQRGMGRGPVALGGGIGTIVLVLLVMFLGGDPRVIMNGGGGGPVGGPGFQAPQQQGEINPEEEKLKELVSVVLADTEDVWHELFRSQGKTYQEPKLVLFSGEVESACGYASAAVGPFYCPANEKVYLDLGFYGEMRDRFKAPGDFAQAYVIAHEIGHHVQNQLGISDRVQGLRGQVSKKEFNELSVRLELQADFFAGVWAHHAQRSRQILEEGDIEEALNAAAAIGDDRLQKQSQGYVVPDSFTHGTSAQRARWFRKGFQTGDMSQGDTFSAKEL